MYTRKIFILLLIVACECFYRQGLCQTQSTPLPVTSHFASMFPYAKNVEWRYKVTDYQVFFVNENAKCEAKFDLDGKWISTERQIKNDSIPVAIKDSIRSGKYGGWNIQSAYVLNFPDQPVQYHIVVSNNDMPNKILFFGKSGQMLKENPSL